jgi:hypothetical protein
MTRKDQVFVANVVGIDLMWKKVALSVISQPTSAIAKLSTIIKIRKYRELHEGHHFILMAMEVHRAPGCDMNCFIKEYARIFHNRQLGGHLSLSFFIQFFKQRVSMTFQCALTSTIENKIVLIGDACSKPPITIRYHDLHASDIRRALGEIASYHKRD